MYQKLIVYTHITLAIIEIIIGKALEKKNTDRDVKVKGTLFYNRLPPSIKQLTGPKFVSKLKLFLLNKCLYSISV